MNNPDVDAYIASAPPSLKAKLLKLRKIITSLAPQAVEGINYKIPGYKLHGKPLIYFAYFKDHLSLFAASGTFLDAYEKDLKNYKTSKGTIHLPLDKPLPLPLIKKLVKAKIVMIDAIKKKNSGSKKTASTLQPSLKSKQGKPAHSKKV